jgi:hypothetical protein
MVLKEIDGSNIDSLIECTWNDVIEKVTNGHPLSSEKTLCFIFAMCLHERVGSNLIVDFENQCYETLEGESKYLDLLFYTKETFKVAIEFKLPKKSKGGASNQPQTRRSIYRDIARLKYLRMNSIKASACYFLMAINEHAYLNNGKYRNHIELKTHHEHSVLASNVLVAAGLSLSGIEFKFSWRGITQEKGKNLCASGYAWLNPIKV